MFARKDKKQKMPKKTRSHKRSAKDQKLEFDKKCHWSQVVNSFSIFNNMGCLLEIVGELSISFYVFIT